MKENNAPLQCIRHRSVLHQTLKTEKWLSKMAQNGYSLVNAQGSRYMFKQTSSYECKYFIINPETGANSDVWVFHEFEQQLGKRIPCIGNSFLSPSHILMVVSEVPESHDALLSYYYQYRNYRLLKRFKRNAVFSAVFFFLAAILAILRFPAYTIALFPYLLVSGLLLFHFTFSYLSFRNDCLSLGFAKPERKPRRPGF